MEKKCNICDSVKNIEDFYKNQTRCKFCTKQYNLENKERIRNYKISYKEEGKRSKSDKKYYLKNKEFINNKNNKYYLENTDKVKKIQKDYRDNNKEILSIKSLEYSKKYYSKKKSDPLFKLKGNCRSMIGNALRFNGYVKNSKTEEILGCTFEDFKLYLESKFEDWMTWENHGRFNSELNYGWDIDHIIPLDSAETVEDIIRLNHFTNLQPLCSYTNRHLKIYKTDFYMIKDY
jgi:hypothetical protein